MDAMPFALVVSVAVVWLITIGVIAYQHRDLDRPRR